MIISTQPSRRATRDELDSNTKAKAEEVTSESGLVKEKTFLLMMEDIPHQNPAFLPLGLLKTMTS